MWTPEKIATLRTMLTAGKTLQECANEFEVSREAIRVAKNRHLPELSQADFGRGVRKNQRLKNQQDAKEERREEIRRLYNRDEFHAQSDVQRAQGLAFTRKRENWRKKQKCEFTITMSDLEWPTHCPVLGIELDWFADARAENSPSFDRIDPTKGYIPGNVAIISWRANRIKNDGTADEHRKIAEWLGSQKQAHATKYPA